MGGGHFGERDLEDQGRFGSLILVHAVVVQTIAAAAGCRIVQRQAKVIATEKPFERAFRLPPPLRVARGAEGIQAGGNHRLRLDRLLVEFRAFPILFVETIAADRAEMSCGGALL